MEEEDQALLSEVKIEIDVAEDPSLYAPDVIEVDPVQGMTFLFCFKTNQRKEIPLYKTLV